MDTRLVITVMLVIAVTVNTATAQNINSTAAPNTTLSAGNSTVAPTTATTTVGNATAAPTTATTTVGNATTTAPTTATTTVGNATTVAATTTPPPLTPNTTVTILNTTISRTGCGTVQLCAAQPSSCDPSTSSSCFFLSANLSGGLNFQFQLAGSSPGYIATTLSPDGTLTNASTYICANNNSVVQFFGAYLNNGILTPALLNVNSVQGKVSGTNIQCIFSATVPTAANKAVTPMTFTISTGSFNSTSGALGTPTPQLKSTVTDLSNASTTVVNLLTTNTTTNTTTTTTTSHGITFQQSLAQALLITLGVLGLAVL